MPRKRGNNQGSLYKRPGRKPWYIAYKNHEGKRVVECSGTNVKEAAARILAERIAQATLRREGVIDARQEKATAHGRRSIEESLPEFEHMMLAAQDGENHIKRTIMYIREIAAEADFTSIADITADGVNLVLADMRREGYAARTIQARVAAIKSFVNWLCNHGKLPTNPLLSVKRPNVEADRKHVRRMLLPDEWHHLRAAILANGIRNGMLPFERVCLYSVAIQTGLRVTELEMLTKAQLFLSGKRPHIVAEARHAKNKKVARQFIQLDLAADLASLVSMKAPAAPVFNIQVACDLAEALRNDMADARRYWIAASSDAEERERREETDFLLPVNHKGEALDFHGLRHTCGAWLAIKGVNPKAIQTVMRHSTITLTMDTYGHLLPETVEDAVNSMADLFNPKPASRIFGKQPG